VEGSGLSNIGVSVTTSAWTYSGTPRELRGGLVAQPKFEQDTSGKMDLERNTAYVHWNHLVHNTVNWSGFRKGIKQYCLSINAGNLLIKLIISQSVSKFLSLVDAVCLFVPD
jgi:hypothetical protein